MFEWERPRRGVGAVPDQLASLFFGFPIQNYHIYRGLPNNYQCIDFLQNFDKSTPYNMENEAQEKMHFLHFALLGSFC